MATNKPQLPKGKGRGRYDKTHQIALLTDFEVEALNHLRWKEKDRGESSGSGELIRELAAKNSRPFSFVDYKGEKIPTLNSSDDAYEGPRGDSGSAGGDDDDNDTYDSSQDDNAGSGTGGTTEPGGTLGTDGGVTTTSDGGTTVTSGSDGSFDWSDYSWNPFDDDYEFNFNNLLDTMGISHGSDSASSLHFQGPGHENETAAEYHARMTGEGSVSEQADNSGVTTGNVEGKAQYPDWNDPPVMHDTQAGADAANAVLLSTAQTGAIGGAEGFEYGTAVPGEDEDGNAITTDESLTGGYSGAYEQMLSDAYDAAKTGVGSGLAGSGGMPTYDDAGNEIDPYAALEGAVAGQNTYLSELATAYQANAQSNYDDWLATNTTAINDLTSLDAIKDYTWTDMPEFDTDLSGGMVDGVWDPDWMPEFYSGFNKEFGKDFLADQNWTYDVDGNRVPGSYNSATTGTTEEEGDEGAITSAPGSAAPGLTAVPGIKSSKQAPSGISQFGSNRSAARYI